MGIDDPERRLRQSLIFARMLLMIAKAISRDYHRDGNHIGVLFGEVLIGTAVYVRTYHRPARPVTLMAIERMTGIPRTTVRRHATVMVRDGILTRSNDGYLFNLDYMTRKQNPSAMRHAINAVIRAARELEKLVLSILAMAHYIA
jgi:hypothetical protein